MYKFRFTYFLRESGWGKMSNVLFQSLKIYSRIPVENVALFICSISGGNPMLGYNWLNSFPGGIHIRQFLFNYPFALTNQYNTSRRLTLRH